MCRIWVLKQRFTLCPAHLRPGFLSWPTKGTFGPEPETKGLPCVLLTCGLVSRPDLLRELLVLNLKQRFTLYPAHLRPGFLSWPTKGTFSPEPETKVYLVSRSPEAWFPVLAC